MEEARWLDNESFLTGWNGRTVQDRVRLVEKSFLALLKKRDTKFAAAVGRNLGLDNYREIWRDIVDAYVSGLCGIFYFTKIDRPGKEYTYFLALTSSNGKKLQYLARPLILDLIREAGERRAARLQGQKAQLQKPMD